MHIHSISDIYVHCVIMDTFLVFNWWHFYYSSRPQLYKCVHCSECSHLFNVSGEKKKCSKQPEWQFQSQKKQMAVYEHELRCVVCAIDNIAPVEHTAHIIYYVYDTASWTIYIVIHIPHCFLFVLCLASFCCLVYLSFLFNDTMRPYRFSDEHAS